MAEVKLWKKQAKYVDKDGQERTATNFFVQCGGIITAFKRSKYVTIFSPSNSSERMSVKY